VAVCGEIPILWATAPGGSFRDASAVAHLWIVLNALLSVWLFIVWPGPRDWVALDRMGALVPPLAGHLPAGLSICAEQPEAIVVLAVLSFGSNVGLVHRASLVMNFRGPGRHAVVPALLYLLLAYRPFFGLTRFWVGMHIPWRPDRVC